MVDPAGARHEMIPVLLPTVTEEQEIGQAGRGLEGSLITSLGIVEGEVLEYLDSHQGVSLRRLNQELEWPAYMVMMAVGALIRESLVQGTRGDLEVVVKRRDPR